MNARDKISWASHDTAFGPPAVQPRTAKKPGFLRLVHGVPLSTHISESGCKNCMMGGVAEVHVHNPLISLYTLSKVDRVDQVDRAQNRWLFVVHPAQSNVDPTPRAWTTFTRPTRSLRTVLQNADGKD